MSELTEEERAAIAKTLADSITSKDGKLSLELPLVETDDDGRRLEAKAEQNPLQPRREIPQDSCERIHNPFVPRQGDESELQKISRAQDRRQEEKLPDPDNPFIPRAGSVASAGGESFVESDPRFVCRDNPDGSRSCVRKGE